MLEVMDIHYRVGTNMILQNVHAQFLPNAFNMIMGPNGSGKSSLLKIICGDKLDFTGQVFLNQVNCKDLSKEQLSKMRAVMTQLPELSFPMQVPEVIMMGRYPHFDFSPTAKDLNICQQVMDLMQLTAFANRNYLTLSGGEQQRVQFARVLAQIWEKPADNQFRYLLLDEPLNNLDIKYQQEFLQVAKSLLGPDTLLIAIMHDLNLAAQFADKIFFMHKGQLMAQGNTHEMLTEELIEKVFDVQTTIVQHPHLHKPIVTFA